MSDTHNDISAVSTDLAAISLSDSSTKSIEASNSSSSTPSSSSTSPSLPVPNTSSNARPGGAQLDDEEKDQPHRFLAGTDEPSTPSIASIVEKKNDWPLHALYVDVQSQLSALQGGKYTDSTARSRAMDEALATTQLLEKKIERAHLFSDNDVIDDLSTETLKYLVVSYLLGDLLMNYPSTMDRRGQYVHGAVVALKKYLDRCDQLMLLNEEAKRALEGKTTKLDPIQARNEKIAKHKKAKALEAKIEALETRRSEYVKRKMSQVTRGSAMAGENTDAAVEAASMELEDEEVHSMEREVTLARLELYVDRALTHLSFARQELELLEHGKKEAAAERERIAKGGIPRSIQLAGLAPPSQGGPGIGRGGRAGGATQSQVLEMMAQAQAGKNVPLQVHRISDHKEAQAPIPDHMKKFLQKVRPSATGEGGDCSQPGHVHNPLCWTGQQMMQQQQAAKDAALVSQAAGHTHGPGCSHGHGHGGGGGAAGGGRHGMSGDPNAPWFRPSAMACEHTTYDDVTSKAGYMMTKVRGGRGKLVPACPLHGNAHPAGECPGIAAGRGGVAAGVRGLSDSVDNLVNMRTDVTQVFRDRNPYLMELDDWARMKQAEGMLPTERDVILSRKRAEEEALRQQRIEDGEDDDEDQARTRREEEELEEEEQLKARAWDDWKDDHEKGAGNKNYRR